MVSFWFRSVLIVLTTLIAMSVTATEVKISAAWIREPPPGMPMSAGYLELTNVGQEAIRLEKIYSDAFSAIELHRTVIENGVSKMRQLNDLLIEPGESVALTPGGMHLMFFGAEHQLVAGSSVDVVFCFGDGRKVTVNMPVRNAVTQ